MKDQFVIAYLADLTMNETVVSHAAALARMLNKGLILLYVEDPAYKNTPFTQIGQTLKSIEEQYADVHPSHIALRGNTKDVISILPTKFNGVVAVAGVNAKAHRGSLTHYRQVLRIFAQCQIAYLTVQSPCTSAPSYRQVAYSVDFRKESKEKLIWASYFARFNGSQLNVMHFDYSDEGLRKKWKNNILFMQKFFKGLGVQYQSHVVTGRTLFPETLVCQTAAQKGMDLLISTTTDTRDLDIIEWFAGVSEHRTIRNSHKIPVLFINPRNDIYVLCD